MLSTDQGRVATSETETERVSFPVTGMTCAACQAFIQKTLEAQPGVISASVNLMLHNATVHYLKNGATPQHLVDAVKATGYGASLESETETNALRDQAELSAVLDGEYRTLRTKAAWTVAAGAVAMLVSMPLMRPSHGEHHSEADPVLAWVMAAVDPILEAALPWLYRIPGAALSYGLLALTLAVVGWAGRQFYQKAWSALRHRTADMNTLVALGTGSALLFSALATVAPGVFTSHGLNPDVYYEAVIFIIGLVLAGHAMEARAKRNTASALQRLVDLQPKTARVIRDTQEVEVATEDLRIGDLLVVRPGERLAADGESSPARAASTKA